MAGSSKSELEFENGDPVRQARVVAVDDQPDSLRLLQARLQAAGIDGVVFSDQVEALNYLKSRSADVVILDVMMPGIDGFEMCRRLKDDPETRDIPVLFLTANMDPTVRVRGLEVGGHDYLNKPVQQDELIARTRAAIRVKQLQDDLRGELQLKEEINQLHQSMLGQHWENTFGQLAASLAHEINNPLAAALGNIQLLGLEQQLPVKIRDRLQLVDKSLQRAAQKLRSLLSIAHSAKEIQDVPVSELVEDLIAVVNYRLTITKATLSKRLDPECRWRGDASDLARALLHLLNNAIDAVTGVSNAHISMRVQRDGDQINIQILDNGSGLDEEALLSVFSPFFTTKQTGHYGLGLYLSKRMVVGAGGSVDVFSPNDEGLTEFRVTLPASKAVASPGVAAISL